MLEHLQMLRYGRGGDTDQLCYLLGPEWSPCLKKLDDLDPGLNRERLKDIAAISRLSEEDTLNLHATTMTGNDHMILWEPETLKVIKEVIAMRSEQLSAWYSMDTGPSVFINTFTRNVEKVASRIRNAGFDNIIISKVGDKPKITDRLLF